MMPTQGIADKLAIRVVVVQREGQYVVVTAKLLRRSFNICIALNFCSPKTDEVHPKCAVRCHAQQIVVPAGMITLLLISSHLTRQKLVLKCDSRTQMPTPS